MVERGCNVTVLEFQLLPLLQKLRPLLRPVCQGADVVLLLEALDHYGVQEMGGFC